MFKLASDIKFLILKLKNSGYKLQIKNSGLDNTGEY